MHTPTLYIYITHFPLLGSDLLLCMWWKVVLSDCTTVNVVNEPLMKAYLRDFCDQRRWTWEITLKCRFVLRSINNSHFPITQRVIHLQDIASVVNIETTCHEVIAYLCNASDDDSNHPITNFRKYYSFYKWNKYTNSCLCWFLLFHTAKMLHFNNVSDSR